MIKKHFLIYYTFFLILLYVNIYGKVEVVCCIPILSEIIQRIGGDAIHLSTLISHTSDPHAFEPTPNDICRITQAEVILFNGIKTEFFLDKLKSSLQKKVILYNTDNHFNLCLTKKEEVNPHWWMSVKNMQIFLPHLCDTLAIADPSHRKLYEKNSNEYMDSLKNLDSWILNQLAGISPEKRIIITSHQSLDWFAHDYRFKVYSLENLSSEDDFSSKHLRDMIDMIKNLKISSIFFEKGEGNLLANQIAQEIRVKVIGPLYTDSLGDGNLSTYEGIMKQNILMILSGIE